MKKCLNKLSDIKVEINYGPYKGPKLRKRNREILKESYRNIGKEMENYRKVCKEVSYRN